MREIASNADPRQAPAAHLVIVTNEKYAELLGREQVLAAFEDFLEYRRGIGYRTADYLQHLGRSGLPLQRLLGLVEQAHVLDRDHGLAGKRLQQVDLLVRENARLGAIDRDRADDLLVPEHRHAEATAISAQLRCALEVRRVVRIGQGHHIGGVDYGPRSDCVGREASPIQAHRKSFVRDLQPAGIDAERARHMDLLAVVAENPAIAGVGQARGTLGDDVEHRLDVGRRFADHLQHFGRRRLPLERLLGLVEQPHVLDRDDGLVGEGLQEIGFALEGISPGVGHARRKRRAAGHHVAWARRAFDATRQDRVSLVIRRIVKRVFACARRPFPGWHGPTFAIGPDASGRSFATASSISWLSCWWRQCVSFRRRTERRSYTCRRPVRPRAARCVEHRLHVRGRTGDYSQDFGRRRLPLERLFGLVEEAGVRIAITAWSARS